MDYFGFDFCSSMGRRQQGIKGSSLSASQMPLGSPCRDQQKKPCGLLKYATLDFSVLLYLPAVPEHKHIAICFIVALGLSLVSPPLFLALHSFHNGAREAEQHE